MRSHVFIFLALVPSTMTGCGDTSPQRSEPAGHGTIKLSDDATVDASTLNVIAFQKDSVIIADHRLPAPFNLSELAAVLGEPDRKINKDNINIVNAWDDLGIVAFQKPGIDTVSSLNIMFIALPVDFSSKHPFTGRIELAQGGFDGSATARTLEAAGLSQSSDFPANYEAETDQYLAVAAHSGALQRFSINWKK